MAELAPPAKRIRTGAESPRKGSRERAVGERFSRNTKYTGKSAEEMAAMLAPGIPDAAIRHEAIEMILHMQKIGNTTGTNIIKALRGLEVAGILPPEFLPSAGSYRIAGLDVEEKTPGTRPNTANRILPSLFWQLFRSGAKAPVWQAVNNALAQIEVHTFSTHATREGVGSYLDTLKTNADFATRLADKGIITDEQIAALFASHANFAKSPQVKADIYYLIDMINRFALNKNQFEGLLNIIGAEHIAGIPDAELRRDARRLWGRRAHNLLSDSVRSRRGTAGAKGTVLFALIEYFAQHPNNFDTLLVNLYNMVSGYDPSVRREAWRQRRTAAGAKPSAAGAASEAAIPV